MTPPGESSTPGRWGTADIAEVRADALDVMADALQWQLAEARWQAIEQILVALDAAIASDDLDALATATADLELAAPLRIDMIGSGAVGPTPQARDLLNRLVHTLGGVAAERPGKQPEDDTGAGDADTSRR